MAEPEVVVVGDANADMIIRLPKRASASMGATHMTPELQGGGTAANVAVALARLGVKAALVGAAGDDGYGRWIVEDLEHEGVDVQGVRAIGDAFTAIVMALIKPDGERMVVVWPPEGGAHTKLQVDMIEPELITEAAWLHTTGMCLRVSPVREAVVHAMELAREAGVTVSLDLNLRKECWGLHDATQRIFEQAIELADIVLGNVEEEIMPIAGTDTAEAAAKILSDGKRIVVARLGSEGALVATPGETFQVPAFQTEVVDTLGAGDAFDGGFIAAILAGADVREATRWGNGVAALKIGHAGARGLPSREELDKMLI